MLSPECETDWKAAHGGSCRTMAGLLLIDCRMCWFPQWEVHKTAADGNRVDTLAESSTKPAVNLAPIMGHNTSCLTEPSNTRYRELTKGL